jgi:hypothetical protein
MGTLMFGLFLAITITVIGIGLVKFLRAPKDGPFIDEERRGEDSVQKKKEL